MQRYTSYLFLWNVSQVVPLPIIRSSKLYTQHQVLCQNFTATCHCCGRDQTRPSLPWQWQVAVKFWQNTWCCVYSLSSWWWAEEPSETCRAFHRNKWVVQPCIFLVAFENTFVMHGHMNVKIIVGKTTKENLSHSSFSIRTNAIENYPRTYH